MKVSRKMHKNLECRKDASHPRSLKFSDIDEKMYANVIRTGMRRMTRMASCTTRVKKSNRNKSKRPSRGQTCMPSGHF